MKNPNATIYSVLAVMCMPLMSAADTSEQPPSKIVAAATPKHSHATPKRKKISAVVAATIVVNPKAVSAMPAVEQAEAAKPTQPTTENPTLAETRLPRSGRIRFEVTRGEGGMVVGESIHAWHHDGKRYTLTATTRTTGLAALLKPATIVQTSQGGFLNGNLKPVLFRYDRGDNDVVEAVFDWNLLQVRFKDGRTESVEEGAEDFLSMFYQLLQAADKKENVDTAVTTGRNIEKYRFEWLDDEDIELKSGRLSARHIRIQAVSGGKDTLEVWLSKTVPGLPVKIRNTDRKGVVFDQIAEELDYEGK